MNRTIFREYDIRGIVGTEFLIEDAHDIGRGILSYFVQHHIAPPVVVVGMDGRTHSPAIKQQLIGAAMTQGFDVIDIGLCPTPVFYFILQTLGIASGLMITASHNPAPYNGIKIILNNQCIWGTELQKIADLVEQRQFAPPLSRTRSVEAYEPIPAYIAFMARHFRHLTSISIDATVDCSNGAAGAVFPALAAALQWRNITILNAAVDGTFPNHEADPTVRANMQQAHDSLMQHDSYTWAFGFDGDADRMAALTKTGRLLQGDELLALYASNICQSKSDLRVVFDIKCSGLLTEQLDRCRIPWRMCASGHSIVKQEMLQHGACLGGELSGHFFFKDRYFGFDDGIYAALRLIELLKNNQRPLDALVALLPQKISTPDLRIPCTESSKRSIVAAVQASLANLPNTSLITIDGVRAQFPFGWGLLRASNTQPQLCLRFEADTAQNMQQIKTLFTQALAPHIPPHLLKDLIELD